MGDALVGVYAGGSIALGDFDPGRSDVDVAAVSSDALPTEQKLEIGAVLRHESLPCPARGLELVVYPASTASTATPEPGYELDLNTGLAMPFRLSLDPADAHGRHWYVIDRAIVREHGLALDGPPPGEVFAAIPPALALKALRESIRWHELSDDALLDDAVLNACRAWRYAADGSWSSKPAAGVWARERLTGDGAALVADALAARRHGALLDPSEVERFLRSVRREL